MSTTTLLVRQDQLATTRLTTTDDTPLAEGRALRDQAEAIPQCVLQSSQCTIAELTALTTELKQLRDRLSEQR